MQVEKVADTNGAGDTFATAYMLALQSGWPSPGSFANWAASRAVMMPQDCKPHCVQQGLHANSTFAQVAKWVSAKVRFHQCSLYRCTLPCPSLELIWLGGRADSRQAFQAHCILSAISKMNLQAFYTYFVWWRHRHASICSQRSNSSRV